MGVHPHAPMKGVQSPCPLCPCSARRTTRTGPGTKPTGLRGGASLRAPGPAAERGPDEAQRALVRSRACAPRRRARRGEPACVLASGARRGLDEEEVARFAPAYASPSPRRVATSEGYPPPASLKGCTDPWVHAPARGEGVYDKQEGYNNPHKMWDGSKPPSESTVDRAKLVKTPPRWAALPDD